MKRFVNFLSSLRLTVVCLSLSILLVFIGTVAQADEGLYQAQARYFKQWYVLFPMLFGYKLPLILPGGYLLGTVLLVNLVAAHIKRFVWAPSKIGVHFTHAGIVVLLVGQLATDMFSVESHLRLSEGQTKNYTESHREHELAFLVENGPGTEEVVSIPEWIVAQKGDIQHERLPMTLRIKEYHINSQVVSRAALNEGYGKLQTALTTMDAQFASNSGLISQAERAVESEGRLEVWRAALKAIGESDAKDVVAAAKRISAQPEQEARLREELKTRFQAEMVSRFRQQGGAMQMAAELISKKAGIESLPNASSQGAGQHAVTLALPETKEMDKNNLPYAVVEVLEGSNSLGTWLLSPWLESQDIKVAGKTWRAAFRPERNYKPFSVQLLKTTHEKYRGTEIPKNFQSRVKINNPVKGETREVDIYMNNPLRYQGLTFFQYQMGQDEHNEVGTSTLQVVKNPSWLTPYLGCILVSFGMCYQFLFHLIGFINKRKSA